MENYRRLNLITGWGIFLISLVVYLLTMEPTTSFWDCGEFIATAYKLEVGHPPGAPFFMVLGRFFTLFAGNHLSRVAVTMNILSAMASAFTVLFLFWTITHLVKKFYSKDEKLSLSALIVILGAGTAGALTYTFSDSFWFSAVEAEVYSTSSLFTAIVFWAILKWENVADEPYANRWLIFIAYLMGLSIGVHLLNLLTIPAIIFVFYFKKYKPSVKGVIASLLMSVFFMGAIMYILIPGLTLLASKFELLFVNGMNLPFNTGVVIFASLLIGSLITLIYYTHARGKVLWNTILLGLFVVIIGYSSYAVIVIRSAANTPLDESNPENVFSLYSYLNREQYGENPLYYGSYFNARPVEIEEGKPAYYRGEDEYYKVYNNNEYKYDRNMQGLFPRMWSPQAQHANEYIYWGKLDESELYDVRRDANGNPVRGSMGEFTYDRSRPIGKPTFGQNLRFFFRYQVGFMYFRYFMWNFAGRQNDIQGHGELTKGNWISGIKFIDRARLGPQDNLPGFIKENKAHNKYYMLPLLLGLIGAYFHYRKHRNDFWVVVLLFVLTGLAIVVYLNQYPLQPRERDYAYAGSFYAFAIWIGIGFAALSDWISSRVRSWLTPSLVLLLVLIMVPGIMAKENWDDHNRSHRYTARAFAHNFLNSCRPNAIMFTNGDNDTFPLWYYQEVEGFRTDVRIVNLSYLTADWYIEQMTYQFYDSDPLPINMTMAQYIQGTRDYAYMVETAGALIQQKYKLNREKYDEELMDIYNRSMTVLRSSLLPANHPKDYEAIKELGENMDILKLYSYLRTFNTQEIINRIKLDSDAIQSYVLQIEGLIKRVDADYVTLKDAMDFFMSDDPRFRDGQYFIPARKFVIPVNEETLPEWVVPEKFADIRVDEVRFTLSDNVMYKNLLTVMSILANNEWQRPVYYSTTVSSDNYLNLEDYMIRENLALRVAPVFQENPEFLGSIDTDYMYKKLMEEFEWGGIGDPRIFMDENNLRMTIHYRYAFAILAGALAAEDDNVRAKEVLDECMSRMPEEIIPYNAGMIPVIQGYFSIGESDTAKKMVEKYAEILESELFYYRAISETNKVRFRKTGPDFLSSIRDINNLRSICTGYGEIDLARSLDEKISLFAQDYERFFR
ncbi:MAG: DUF2723 domain-containing protein [Bacteroidales bacterium]|nr:DUF2723 domain-containing protein [Bacteroidales bacterium]MBN2698684.1 DUF2723 domain-containing protein [Bacteroidales bacterium]